MSAPTGRRGSVRQSAEGRKERDAAKQQAEDMANLRLNALRRQGTNSAVAPGAAPSSAADSALPPPTRLTAVTFRDTATPSSSCLTRTLSRSPVMVTLGGSSSAAGAASSGGLTRRSSSKRVTLVPPAAEEAVPDTTQFL